MSRPSAEVPGMISLRKIQEHSVFMNRLAANQVSILPAYNMVTQPPEEVQFAREKYRLDKVKIKMKQKDVIRDRTLFPKGIPTPYGGKSRLEVMAEKQQNIISRATKSVF